MSETEPIRILCLEDDPGTARLLQKRLTHAGYDVDLASDGEQGLAIYKAGSFHVLCVDHHMPGLTGLEVIQNLSAEGTLPPTIMVTAGGDERIAVEALKLGASDYVIKDSGNVYLDLIAPVVQGALEKQHLFEEKRRAELALQRAHDELEMRVKERTAELAQTNEELRNEIAQRKRAEEEIIRQKAFLDTVLESLTHPFYVIDVESHTIMMANSASRQAASGTETTCYELTHQRSEPCDSTEHPCPIKEVSETKKPVSVEHVHYDAKGNARVVEIHAYPIFDDGGKVTRIIEYALDITDRKEAEDTLRELLETSSNIVKNIPSGLLVYQYQAPGELFLVNANREAFLLTGISVEKWRGQEFDEMWPNARVQGLTQALLRTMASGETFAMEDAIFKTDDIERVFRLRAFTMPGDLLGIWFESAAEKKADEYQVKDGSGDSPITRPPGAPEQAELRDHSLRLLLVVDVSVVAGILQKALGKLGQHTTVVASEHEAVDAIAKDEFSAIVCDVTLGEMNGRQIAETINEFCQETGISKPPFVLMTQAGAGTDISGSSVDLVVEKPIDFNELLEVIRNIVR